MASPEKSLGAKKKSPSKSKKKSAKHRIRHTHIEHTDDGGHFVRHQYDQGGPDEEPTPDSTHALPDSSALLGHLQDQLGGQLPAPQGEPGAAGAGAGAGAGAAVPPQPGM